MSDDVKTNYCGYFASHQKVTLDADGLEKLKKLNYSTYQRIRANINLYPDQRILEIGSGIGWLYDFLPYKGDYTGLEIDRDAARFTKGYFRTDSFVEVAIEDFQEKEKYDLVFAIELLEHLRDPARVLHKVFDLMKPGGVFCGTTPYPFKKNVMDPYHIHVLHPKNWERLILDAGFKNVDLRPMSFIPFFWRFGGKLNPAIPMYLPFRYMLSTCLFIAKK